MDFSDRTQFGTTGTSGTGWAVDNGINGYSKVFRGDIRGNSDQDLIKVYLYAGERLRIDVDGTLVRNAILRNITREVFGADGVTSVMSATTSDAWFTATTNSEYFIKLNHSGSTQTHRV